MEQHPLFSSRDTLDEALVYGVDLLNTLPPEHRRTAFTAFHVLANTAIKLEEGNLRNLVPDWTPKGAQAVGDNTPQVELLQHLRNYLAPVTYAIADSEEKVDGQTVYILRPGTTRLLSTFLMLFCRACGLNKEAHAEEAMRFAEFREQAAPSTPEALVQTLLRVLNRRD